MIGFQPWAGDLPKIYFAPNTKTTFVFTGNCENGVKTWDMYNSFRLSEMDKIKYGDEFSEFLPEWSFIVSNDIDEVSVMPNAGSQYFTWRNATNLTEMTCDISIRDAKQMSRELWNYKDSNIPKAVITENVEIKPLGCVLTYYATKHTIVIDDE
jgi:hypothetical protein